MMSDLDVVLIYTTLTADDHAIRLARTLVEERLAACVQVHSPMTSVYRWKEEVQEDTERQVVIKTTRDRVDGVRARLVALHPYDVPEFIVVAVESGSAAYLQWVIDETRSVP